MGSRFGDYVTSSSLPEGPDARAEMIRNIIIELIRCIPVRDGKMDWNTLKIYVKEPLKNIMTPFDTRYENGVRKRFTIIGYTIEEKADGHKAGNGADHPEGL